jgi:Na+-driven multidrug efflux pump
MEIFNIMDKKVRNISILVLIIGIILLIIWLIIFIFTPGDYLVILYIGIGIFLAGILILTRIQFVIWTKETHQKSHDV